MAQHNESAFEKELCAHLAANGWLHSSSDAGYDRARALFPEDVLGWLADTQQEELAKVVKPSDAPAAQAKSREQLLERVVKVLSLPLDAQGGVLRVLRKGFKHQSASFDMCQFRPADELNPTTLERYGKVRLRVMQQVHYSSKNQNSIDLVFFVNGIPVATTELKTDFTQSVHHAIAQYVKDRRPAGESLLTLGSGALVHFAVSNTEVWMSTDLRPAHPRFRPLNKGNDGHAGNPPNPHGSPASYFWEQILDRDVWLGILGRFMLITTRIDSDPKTGAPKKSHGVLFPRYHQWDAVTKMVETARTEGPGAKYLIQHSAGSGKTNSIAWTAQQLSTLHGVDGKKVFDSVIIVTDRNVLDAQLKDAMFQIESQPGVVVAVGDTAGESKSKQLAAALTSSASIIVVTMQTFPFAIDAITGLAPLKGKSFAVIADEAHSSQTGNTANKLKEILSPAELADVADGAEYSSDDLLAAMMAGKSAGKNISYFAFTATPKAKTLELFGRTNDDGMPAPFHLYSMQQAIEEEYIRDVLQNYLPYKTAWKLAHDGTDYDSDTPIDQVKAAKSLIQWVKLHPHAIGQKVGIITEHFRDNVAHLLDGHAKAMVVTGSRKEAVRYKVAFDRYLKDHGYTDLAALVAFSGEVHDDHPGLGAVGGTFTETSMNPGLKGRSLAGAFDTDEFQVMLVANKFQTGFDQPLLVAMYVDKKLSGVTAVQTLSRLNRIYPGKDRTFVLDFVNDPQAVLDAFQPYYTEATLGTVSDQNVVHDLAAKLDGAQLYTGAELDGCAAAYLRGEGNNALTRWITPARDKFLHRIEDAKTNEDKVEFESLRMFRSDLTAYIRAYDFLSQIFDYSSEVGLEKRAIFYRLLAPTIREAALGMEIDLSAVELKFFKTYGQDSTTLVLDGKGEPLQGMTAAGSAQQQDPKLARLREIVEQLNTLFDDVDFTDSDRVIMFNHIRDKMAENENLQGQARANTSSQFADSPDVKKAFSQAVMGAVKNHSAMGKKLLNDDEAGKRFLKLLLPELYDLLNDVA
ncbi:MAG: DEAD/DEAH box helicase family protein [Nakamurella sp.]